MASLAFILGGITFDSFEMPEEFSDGLETSYDKKDHPGGGRTITIFGVHDMPVSWSGWLWGASARDRLDALKRLQLAAQPVKWTYGRETWVVVITKCIPKRSHQNKIRYEIEVEIVDRPQGPPTPEKEPDTDTKIAKALQQTTQTINAPAQASFFPGVVALNLFNAFAATMDAASPWTSLSFDSASQLIAQALGVEGAFEAIAGPLRAANTLEQMQGLIDCEDAMAGVRQCRLNLAAYFGAYAVGQLVANTSAWELAAQQWGDPTQALDLMASNGLTDPEITGPITIAFPPAAPGTFDVALIGNNGAS
jgi:hypothetical protein